MSVEELKMLAEQERMFKETMKGHDKELIVEPVMERYVHRFSCIDEIKAILSPDEFKGYLKGKILEDRYTYETIGMRESDYFVERLMKELK